MGTRLKDMAELPLRFIELYVDCVATRENVGLLYHIASKIKTVRDSAEDVTDNSVCQIPCTSVSLLMNLSVESVPLKRAGTGDHQEPRRGASLDDHHVSRQSQVATRHLQ